MYVPTWFLNYFAFKKLDPVACYVLHFPRSVGNTVAVATLVARGDVDVEEPVRVCGTVLLAPLRS